MERVFFFYPASRILFPPCPFALCLQLEESPTPLIKHIKAMSRAFPDPESPPQEGAVFLVHDPPPFFPGHEVLFSQPQPRRRQHLSSAHPRPVSLAVWRCSGYALPVSVVPGRIFLFFLHGSGKASTLGAAGTSSLPQISFPTTLPPLFPKGAIEASLGVNRGRSRRVKFFPSSWKPFAEFFFCQNSEFPPPLESIVHPFPLCRRLSSRRRHGFRVHNTPTHGSFGLLREGLFFLGDTQFLVLATYKQF